MKTTFSILYLCSVLSINCMAQMPPIKHLFSWPIPNTQIVWVQVHRNETTALSAIQAFSKNRSYGQMLWIHGKKERNIRFKQRKNWYEFDPNRIFTDSGIVHTLRNFNSLDSNAFHLVKAFRNKLLSPALDSAEVIFALHNNSDLGGLQITSYLPRGDFESEAAEVWQNPQQDTDDFYFTTNQSFFTYLKAAGQNVVLQNNQGVTDDGSLSVWAANKQKPYLNIEAQHGHYEKQLAMIQLAWQMLDDLGYNLQVHK